MIRVGRRYGGSCRFAPQLTRRHWRRMRYLPVLKPATRRLMRQLWRRRFFYRSYRANWQRWVCRQQPIYPPGTVLSIGASPEACVTCRHELGDCGPGGIGLWLDPEAKAYYLVVDHVVATVFCYTGRASDTYNDKAYPAYDIERRRQQGDPVYPFVKADQLIEAKKHHHQWLQDRNKESKS